MTIYTILLALLVFVECGQSAQGTLTTNANQFLGVPLSLKDGVTLTNAQLWGAPLVNVKLYGATGDGITDDFLAISNAIAAASSYQTLYFPVGTYKVNSPIDISTKPVHMLGEGRGGYSFGGSRIYGSFSNQATVVWSTEGSDNGPIIQGLHIGNNHSNGVGIRLSGFISGVVRDCEVTAWRGIDASTGCFTLSIENCRIIPVYAGIASNSIGIMAGNHVRISSCDIVAFEHGIRAGGIVSIQGCRIEVNKVGIMLGMQLDGSGYGHFGMVAGNSFEANDVGIRVHVGSATTIMGNLIQGSTSSPSGGSQSAIEMFFSVNTVLLGNHLSGTYTVAPIVDVAGNFIENTAYLGVTGRPFSVIVSNNTPAISVSTNQSTTILQLNQ